MHIERAPHIHSTQFFFKANFFSLSNNSLLCHHSSQLIESVMEIVHFILCFNFFLLRWRQGSVVWFVCVRERESISDTWELFHSSFDFFFSWTLICNPFRVKSFPMYVCLCVCVFNAQHICVVFYNRIGWLTDWLTSTYSSKIKTEY